MHISNSSTTATLHVLQAPLFRVRNKWKTIYCYSETERNNAVREPGGKPDTFSSTWVRTSPSGRITSWSGWSCRWRSSVWSAESAYHLRRR